MESTIDRRMGRRRFITTASAATAALWLAGLPKSKASSLGKSCPPQSFRIALSVSPHTERMLDQGITYRFAGQRARTTAELQRMFMECGSTEMWARIGTSRVVPVGAKESTQPQLQMRARLSRELNIPFNPEFLLCAHYGDVGLQPAPDFTGYESSGSDALALPSGKQWHELSLNQMTDLMRTYGRIAAREILDIGAQVNVWDIGNEIEFGTAGVAIHLPNDGKGYRAPDSVNPKLGQMSFMKLITSPSSIDWCRNELWPGVAAILSAVAEGIRQVDSNARFATHSSTVATFVPGFLAAFHEAMEKGGFHAEHLGTSWYPTSTAQVSRRMDLFKQQVQLARQRVGKPVFIAEYAYAAAPVTFQGQNWANPVEGYPISSDSSAKMLNDITAWGASTGNLSGIRPYGPDLVKDSPNNWLGMALFDLPTNSEAVARSSLTAMQQALCRRDRF